MKKITCLAVAAFSLFFITACNNENKSHDQDSVEQAQEVNDDKKIDDGDSKFVTEAAASGMREVELSKLAAEKATSADVKSFAQKMVEDHSKANSELKALAEKKQITVPAEMDGDTKSAMEELAKKSGAEFDKEYMDRMVSDHKDAVDKFDNAAKDAHDSDIKAWAGEKLPTLRMHMEMADKMKEGMDKNNKGNRNQSNNNNNHNNDNHSDNHSH